MTVSNVEYSCGSCSWVYRPSEQRGLEFADVASDWACLNCQAEQDQFSVCVPPGLEVEDSENNGSMTSSINVSASTTEVPPEQRVLYTKKVEHSIFELHRQWQLGEMNVQPEFQRYYVWSAKQESRLIESIFLNVPIPLVYFAEELDGTFAVIDGQQRLTALFRFIDGKYAITGLEQRSDLNGKRFADLNRELQRKFENYTLSIVQILKESESDVRFEVFERLNTGATKLNDQEIRNCVFRGPFNNFLRHQAKYKPFLRLLGLNEPDQRMSDMELVLRFAAFWDQTYLHFPKQRLKAFLNREMERGRSFTPIQFADLEKAFRNAVQLSQTVFGDHAFKRFNSGTHSDPQGKWENKANKAVYDIVMWGFTRYSPAQVVPMADTIFEELVNLMSTDREFIDAITYDTANDNKVRLRFSRWQTALENIIGYRGPEPRTFSLAWKKQLFEANSTCALCGQQIRFLDDAHVHHVQHYWRGGRTSPENSALVLSLLQPR
jgi:rubredoxin